MSSTMRAPGWLRGAVLRLEHSGRADVAGSALRPVAARLGQGRTGELLRGEWLGHALHPLLTDLPLGCFLGSGLLDLVGGGAAREGSRRLLGLGLLAAVPTAASGLADWLASGDTRVHRVGPAHAATNAVMLAAYLASWQLRGRGRHAPGVALGMLGGTLGWVSGYLGGHMSFNLGHGTGDRGLRG